MNKPSRPILITIHIASKMGLYYPSLSFHFYNELHPEGFDCQTPYPSKQEATEEAARMICTFLEANKGIEDLIEIEVSEDEASSQFAKDGTWIN